MITHKELEEAKKILEMDNEPEEEIGEPAVMCTSWGEGLPGCGRVVLTQEQYERQLSVPSKTWRCPICRCEAEWCGTGIYE